MISVSRAIIRRRDDDFDEIDLFLEDGAPHKKSSTRINRVSRNLISPRDEMKRCGAAGIRHIKKKKCTFPGVYELFNISAEITRSGSKTRSNVNNNASLRVLKIQL